MLKLPKRKQVNLVSDLYWLNPFYSPPDPEPILRDAFEWEDNGIFVAIKNVAANLQIELPWDDDDAETLDLSYFGNHSGGKFCSPIVKLFLMTESLVDENGRINSTGTNKLAAILLRKYYTNWKSLWATNVASYNPIHNYDMTENRVKKSANSEQENNSENQSHTGTSTLQHGLVETTQHGKTVDATDYKYGLNTDTLDPKPSDASTTAEGGSTVVTDSGSDVTTRNLADTTAGARTLVGADEEDEEIHRAGNIGVTTTQKLLQEERELWLWNYFDQIFADIDRELTLCFYDSCRV